MSSVVRRAPTNTRSCDNEVHCRDRSASSWALSKLIGGDDNAEEAPTEHLVAEVVGEKGGLGLVQLLATHVGNGAGCSWRGTHRGVPEGRGLRDRGTRTRCLRIPTPEAGGSGNLSSLFGGLLADTSLTAQLHPWTLSDPAK